PLTQPQHQPQRYFSFLFSSCTLINIQSLDFKMEKNSDSQIPPEFCINNCGFYGKPASSLKGRCAMCRARIPLVKQTTNKCRCDKVFCDVHKFPDLHSCDFDFLQRDRSELLKKNPRINDQPKGGRTFTRID
ncbi:hypothetical protein BB560_005702, partial [Smittium megazygosporum]